MDKHSVFSKTGKGLLEIKNRGNRLPKDQFRILNLVDGKTVFADLAAQSRVPEIELRKIVTALSDGGYIKELVSPAGEAGDLLEASAEDDLDFTKMLTDTPAQQQPRAVPVPPPPAPRTAASPSPQPVSTPAPAQPMPRVQAPPAQEQSEQRSRLEEAYTRRQAEEQQRKAQQPKPAPAPPDQEEGTDLEAELEALRNQMAPSPGSGLTTQPTARPVIETQPGADTAEPPRDLNDAFERARREAEQRAREEAVRLQQAAMERRSRTPRKPGK
jgi:hypothetical protein